MIGRDSRSAAAVLLVAVMAAACAGDGDGGGGGQPRGTFDDPPPQTPQVFAEGVISTEAQEWRVSFTPDGRTAFFARSQGFFPQTREATIMVSRFEDGRWGEPEVAPFSGEYPDIDPFVSPDGETLFFSSLRPVAGEERDDTDLWLVRRQPDGDWGEPEHLGEAVNSDTDDLYASAAADGTLYFGSERGGDWDIYRSVPDAEGWYGPAENLGPPVNTGSWEFNPTITPDGEVLIFTALARPGGRGAGDIWVSRLVDGQWSEPVGIGDAVNTSADEYHPSLSPSLDRLFYVVRGDLQQVSVAALENLPALSWPEAVSAPPGRAG